MKSHHKTFNQKQLYFKELFVGTLIYAVVLGFFNDYTSIVYAQSFSTIFFASIVLEILTFLVFQLKDVVVARFKERKNTPHKVLFVFIIWFIMFSSKFVFVWTVDLIFGEKITINGFFGILAVALSVTVIHKLADLIFIKLGDDES